ncbi:hypothetical protein [Streptomyces sp. NPDC047024]|uniref:hypothetical protein n=1 Tax=Streptomyces sp. NPDC047024 TaxID=3155476 RepID=UPI0033FC0C8C
MRFGVGGAGVLAAVLVSVCLTSCTSGTARTGGSGGEPQPRVTASARPGANPAAERELAAQARAALDAGGSRRASMVESGVERVSEGVHTEPGTQPGRVYRLTVVCAGQGTAKVTLASGAPVRAKTVPCDRSEVFERFMGARGVRIDVDGGAGATGMIAWRIDRV